MEGKKIKFSRLSNKLAQLLDHCFNNYKNKFIFHF